MVSNMNENEIIETQDGSHSIFSHKFGVSFHSKYGAIQESQHVFIEAGLYRKILTKKNISILEIGFGAGLNAFLTFLEAEKRNLQVYYETVDAYPISLDQVKALNYPALLDDGNNSGIFLKMHELEWNKAHLLGDCFTLKKVLHRFEELEFEEQFDLIYFDAFSPEAQPELWEPHVLQKVFDALHPEGIMVTYCAKGAVKRTLKEIGFEVEALKGPPGKREMTRCEKTVAKSNEL